MKKISKTAFITGVSGQDGAYLAKLLLSKKYQVVGLDRRSSRNNDWRLKFLGIENKIIREYCELSEFSSLQRIFEKYKYNVDEVYNLAAQSFVGSSFDTPISTSDVNAFGPLRILEIIRSSKKKIKFYQASTSEMFGNNGSQSLDENSFFNPQSPYAISKLYAHHITQNYRNSYGIFSCSGILFNHESPLRGEEFVTRKIVLGLINILKKKQSCLYLGNIHTKRDWGYAEDYVEAMWKMLQAKKPKDYVVATNKAYSVKDFANRVCKYLQIKITWRGTGLKEEAINLENNKTIIKISKKFYRPSDVFFLKGNFSKIKKELGWQPRHNLDDLVKFMIDSES